MLDLMRRNAGSWVIKGILFFIALTFIWWGVGSFTGESAGTVAVVGKRKITQAELEQAVASLEKTYRDVYGAAFTREMARALDLKKQALEKLVDQEILLSEAKRMGLSASDTEVRRDISTNPAFQVNGAFSEERYRSILEYNRMTPGDYEGAKRTEITLRKVEGVVTAAARVTDAEARELFDLSRRRVRLAVAVFDPARAKGAAEPAEAEIAARYAEGKEKFRTPARVRLTVAKFTPEAFGAAGPAPTEAELNAYYEGNPEKFRTAEEREVTRAFFPDAAKDDARGKASELSTRPFGVKDEFVKEARKAGAAVSSSTLLRKGGEDEVEKAIFSAGAGGVVGPLAVDGGIALYRVDRVKFPEPIPFAQSREKVEQALRRERGRDQAVIAAYKARESAEKAGTLAGSLPPFVPAVESGWLDGGEASEGIPPAVVQEALVLPVGAIAPVKSLGDVHYLVRVAAKEESRVPALAEVKERLAAELRAQKRAGIARAEATKVATGAKGAADLDRLAKAGGGEVLSPAPFAPASGELPAPLDGSPAAREEIARLSLRAPVLPRPFESGGRFLVVALASEETPAASDWTAERDAFLKKAREAKKEEILSSFLTDKRRETKVTVNPELLK